MKKYNTSGNHMGGGLHLVNDDMTDQRENGFVFAISLYDASLGINPCPTIFTTDLNGEFDGFMKRYVTDPSNAATNDVEIFTMKSGTSDDGFFIYGNQYDNSHNYFIRTSASGMVSWSTELEVQLTAPWLDTDLENIQAIQLQDGNILVSGGIRYKTNTTIDEDIPQELFIMKLDNATGSIHWKNRILSSSVKKGFMPRDLIETTPGNYYIVGGGHDIGSEFEEFLIHIEDFGSSISADLMIFPFEEQVELSKLLFESSKLTVCGTDPSDFNSLVFFRIGTDLNNLESLNGTPNAFSRYSSPVNLKFNDAVYLNDRLNISFLGDNLPEFWLSNGILVLGNDGSIINSKIGEEYPYNFGNKIYKTDDGLYTTSLVNEAGGTYYDNFRLNRWSTIGNTCIEDPYNMVSSEKEIYPKMGITSVNPVIVEYLPLAVNPTSYNFTKENICSECDLTAEDVGSITTSTGDSTLCDISSITLFAPTGAGYTYQWFKDGILIDSETTSSIDVTEGGTYSVVITDEFGCSVELIIKIIPGVDVSDIDGNIYCLYLYSSYPLLDYGDGGSWSGTSVIEVAGNYYFNPFTEGVYTLTYCDPYGCCADATVTVQSPEIEILDINGACEGDCSGSITATVDGADYDWQLLLDGAFYDDELTTDIVNFSSLCEGDYELLVVDSEGCKSNHKFTITSGGWHKQTVNTTGTESANDVVTDANGNVYMVGTFSETTEIHGGGNPNILVDSDGSAEGTMFLAKYDECGTLLWAAHSSGATLCSGEGLILDETNGMVYVTGDLKSTALFHSAESADNLCTIAGDTEFLTAPTTKSGYIAQYDMNTGCLYFANAYSDGVAQSTTSITIDESTGDVFVGGAYQLSLTSPENYLFVRKYNPEVLSGELNTLGSLMWAAYDNTSTNPMWNKINNMDYDETRKFLYAIGDYHGGASVLTSTIAHAGYSTDAFLLTLRDAGTVVTVYDLRGGNGSLNGFMTGEGVAIDDLTGTAFLTGSYDFPNGQPFFFSGIPTLGAFGGQSKSYMISGHVDDATMPWSRYTMASPIPSGWVRGKDVSYKDGQVLFCNEFSGSSLGIAPGGGFGISYPFIGESTGSGHIGVISYSSSGVRNWGNVTESISTSGADNHKVNAVSIGESGNAFMAGSFRNTMSYNSGTPYSGDLLLSGLFGGYNACVLRVNNASGELKSNISHENTASAVTNVIDFDIWPNPNNGKFEIQIEDSEELTEIFILDMYGSVVYEQIARKASIEINLTHLSRGMYLLKLVRGENSQVEKIIVQ
ncbi:MAG: T9SS type A sorting domain-containing protein [Crocinitomicaceae bacterium]|nr:T9SS type A sorting domain-containing protein [Crocinitomicaceae bacterium]